MSVVMAIDEKLQLNVAPRPVSPVTFPSMPWHFHAHAHAATSCPVQILAKEIVHSRKAISRLYVNKAQMISIGNALTEQLGETAAAVRDTAQPATS